MAVSLGHSRRRTRNVYKLPTCGYRSECCGLDAKKNTWVRDKVGIKEQNILLCYSKR